MAFEVKTVQHLWAKIVNTSNFFINRSPTLTNFGVTPFQIFFRLEAKLEQNLHF
jgi:hypothetical protein